MSDDMAAILRARTEELDLVTHQRDALRGEITLLRTENTRLRNSNQVDRDLLAELVEAFRQLVEAFRRREARRDVQLATLRAGLREIESSTCHHYLHRPFGCFEFGRTLSVYGADRACDACIAHRALRESEAT